MCVRLQRVRNGDPGAGEDGDRAKKAVGGRRSERSKGQKKRGGKRGCSATEVAQGERIEGGRKGSGGEGQNCVKQKRILRRWKQEY